MNNNELRAQLLIEAADLLAESEQDSLNEASTSSILTGIKRVADVMGTVIMTHDKETNLSKYINNESNQSINIKDSKHLVALITTDLKKIVLAMKKDESYKKIINESISGLKKTLCYSGSDDYYNGIGCKSLSDKSNNLTYQIILGSSAFCSELAFIIDDLQLILNKKWKIPMNNLGVKIDTGDGDEGFISFIIK